MRLELPAPHGFSKPSSFQAQVTLPRVSEDQPLSHALKQRRAQLPFQTAQKHTHCRCMLPRSTYLVPMTIPAFKEHCPEVGIQLYEEIAYSDIEKDLLEGRKKRPGSLAGTEN